jgi:alpha-glucoside transport system substrate-binding protein
VFGGSTSILERPFGDGVLPLVQDPPEAWLHKQANFILGFLPEDVSPDEDLGYFLLPPIDEELGTPALIAGDIASAVTDRPETRALMRYLSQARSTRHWVESGSMIAPHRDARMEWYPDETSRGMARLLADADTVRFDASDMMPGGVGNEPFWAGMSDWIAGEDIDLILARLDEQRP